VIDDDDHGGVDSPLIEGVASPYAWSWLPLRLALSPSRRPGKMQQETIH